MPPMGMLACVKFVPNLNYFASHLNLCRTTNSVFAIDSVAAAPYLPPPPSTTETGTQLPVSRSTAWRKRKMEKAGATEVLFYTENDNSSLCIILR
ncbi:hypothetical protein DPEC_G00371480 [Dallia pectoralis]|nr:hypothetical protein DPEC_G00371480 [Dallia pectoralis]